MDVAGFSDFDFFVGEGIEAEKLYAVFIADHIFIDEAGHDPGEFGVGVFVHVILGERPDIDFAAIVLPALEFFILLILDFKLAADFRQFIL